MGEGFRMDDTVLGQQHIEANDGRPSCNLSAFIGGTFSDDPKEYPDVYIGDFVFYEIPYYNEPSTIGCGVVAYDLYTPTRFIVKTTVGKHEYEADHQCETKHVVIDGHFPDTKVYHLTLHQLSSILWLAIKEGWA